MHAPIIIRIIFGENCEIIVSNLAIINAAIVLAEIKWIAGFRAYLALYILLDGNEVE